MPTRPRRIIHPWQHRQERANRVQIAHILGLIDSIKDVANKRQWPADLLSHYSSTLKKIAKRMRYIERLNARRAVRMNVIQWQRDTGARLARTRDIDELLAWLLD